MTGRNRPGSPSSPKRPFGLADLRAIGPGLVIAATGVGAGDLIAAAVSGSRFGLAIGWAALVGALFKFTLNEGLARWQLATGTTLLEGWSRHLGAWVSWLFMIYLVGWSFSVAGALINACGLAAHALAPGISREVWGIVHSVVAAALVMGGGYRTFERLIGVFVGLMFVTLVTCAILIESPVVSLAGLVREAGLPHGSAAYVLGVIGGVGGSVTLLAYGYWIREKGWETGSRLRVVRLDLGIAYALTGVFGLAVMVLAAAVLHGDGVEIAGASGVLRMSAMLSDVVGKPGEWIFLVGVWGAMATSMLGVWQGIPYLFADFAALMRGGTAESRRAMTATDSPWYRGFLLWLCGPPLVLLVWERPIEVIVFYAVLSALFMPFLTTTLLVLNSRERYVGPRMKNGWLGNAMLVLCLVLFVVVAWGDIARVLTRI